MANLFFLRGARFFWSVLILAFVISLALTSDAFATLADGAAPTNAIEAEAKVEPPVPAAAQHVSFARACEAGDQLVISAVGDVLPQSGLAEQAYASKQGFESLWSKLTPYFQKVDIAYGNLEGPVAAGVALGGKLKGDPGPVLDRDVYTGSNLSFNYNPLIVGDLKRTGFTLLSVANNHALDRENIGLDRTIDAFRSRDMLFVGARRSNETGTPPPTIVERKGFRIAFIACTEAMNHGDTHGQILACMRDQATILNQIQTLAQDRTIDAVIVTPHWGDEYHHIAATRQRVLARKFLDAGASAIIGSHPHMLEEMESYRTLDGRDTVIAYSLGNFVSGQGLLPGHKTSALLFVGFTKRAGERAWVNGVSYLPLWMDRGPHSINLVSQSKQAPREKIANIIYRLFDPSRELKAGAPIRTNLECP